MEAFTLVDPAFNLENTQHYHLSIQAGLNGYAFAILDTSSQRYLAARYYPFNKEINLYELHEMFSGLLESDQFLSRDYQSIYFAPADAKSTLIPGNYYDKDTLSEYASLNFTPGQNELLETDRIDKHGIVNLYALDGYYSTILLNKNKNVKIFHPGTALITSVLGYPYNKVNVKRVFAEIQDKKLIVAVSNASKLLFYNNFDYKTPEDMVYYLMNVFELHQLSPERTPLLVSGQVEQPSPLYDMLKRFFGAMKFLKLNNKYSYTREFNKQPEHWLINLFNLYECGL